MLKVKQLVLAGLLLAAIIVLVRFLSVQTPFVRLSFGFIPFALAGWLLGPVWGAVIGVASDLLGMLLFPTASFFAGFTLSALLEGLIYGLFLYNRPVNKWLYFRLALCLLALHIFIQLGLTTLWLSIMYKQAFIPMMISRVLTNIIRFPIELAALGFLMTVIEEPVNKYYRADFSAGNDDDAIDSTDPRSDDKDE